MKLKHKLIPLASIGAVCATVTPLVTSCGTGWVDVTDKFVPTIAQYPKEGVLMNYSEVTKEYLRALKANKDIFRQDYLWSMSNLIATFNGGKNRGKTDIIDIKPSDFLNADINRYIAEVKAVDEAAGIKLEEKTAEIKELVDKTKVNRDKIKLTVVDVQEGINSVCPEEYYYKVPLISFDLEYTYQYTTQSNSKSFEGTEKEIMKGVCHYKNIPFLPWYNPDNHLFEFLADCPAADVSMENALMTSDVFYKQNRNYPWSVDVEYSGEYQAEGTMPVVGKINFVQKVSNDYSINADELWAAVESEDETKIEEVRQNFVRACTALNEDGYLSSYYLYPVSYNGKW